MNCELCRGKGFLYYGKGFWPQEPDQMILIFEPCPDCGGYTVIHCCEGEQAQPEKDER